MYLAAPPENRKNPLRYLLFGMDGTLHRDVMDVMRWVMSCMVFFWWGVFDLAASSS